MQRTRDGSSSAAPRTAYGRVADYIRQAIATGELAAGDRVPSESELTERFVVARGTVRQAMKLLEADGEIEIVHGKGTFVRGRPPVERIGVDAPPPTPVTGDGAGGRGADVASRRYERLYVGPGTAEADVADRLGPKTRVLIRRRREYIDNVPVREKTSYIPMSIARGTLLENEDIGRRSVRSCLDEIGHGPVRYDDEVSARTPTERDRDALRLSSGVPVIQQLQTAYDASGSVVEVRRTVMRADRFALTYSVKRRPSSRAARRR
ncbi:MAG: GntR family transcriptional regulator [Desertimonas sp.]